MHYIYFDKKITPHSNHQSTMVNKVILVGRLGKDPEVVDIGNGIKKASFSVATSEAYRDRTTNEKKEITDWHNVVLWRGLAEVAEKFLHKGDLVYIEGKIKTRSYQDKEGNDRYITEIVADSMNMLSPKGSGNSSAGADGSAASHMPPPPAPRSMSSDEDDLPF